MSYPVDTMIGIRIGGVFAGTADMEDLKERIIAVIGQMETRDIPCDISAETLDGCISPELTATKGSYVVIAGIFNYWRHEHTAKFGRQLSAEFGTEVMVMTWDETQDTRNCEIFLAGRKLQDAHENPVSQLCRRVS